MIHYWKLIGHTRYYAYYNGRTVIITIGQDVSVEIELHNYKYHDFDNLDPELFELIGAERFNNEALSRITSNILPEVEIIKSLSK